MVLPDDYVDPPRVWLKWVKWLAIPVVLISLGAVYLSDVWHAAYWLTDEERDREAVYMAYEAVAIYILQVGHWPKNEKEYRQRLVGRIGRSAGTYYRWPDDATRILRQVHVDYDVPLDQVVKADVKNFPYIYSKKHGPGEYWKPMAERVVGSCNSRIDGERIQSAVVPKFDLPKSEKPADGAKTDQPKPQK